MRKRKVYLEDQLDSMIDLLYRARRVCHSPGDKFALDLLLDVRDLSRRVVRSSRSRLYQARVAGSVSVGDLKPGKFLQPDFFR